MMDDLTKLKPCPFCGNPATVFLRGDDRIEITCFRGCDCHAVDKVDREDGFTWGRMKLDDILKAYNNAAAQWNRRWG